MRACPDDAGQAFESEGVKPAVLLCLDADDSHGVYTGYTLVGAAKEKRMFLKPPHRRGTKGRRKSSWLRPKTVRLAFYAMWAVEKVAKLIDLFFG